MSFPQIVHFIYFPWDRNGILKDNENDFDHHFLKMFKKNNSLWEIKLWTLSKTKEFVQQNYPNYWNNIWILFSHPIQAIDFFRLLIVYHFGGIFWQYESKQCRALDNFIPISGKKCKLFVESVITKKFSENMKKERLRNNKPEELVRVALGCFSAYPKEPFLWYCIQKSIKNHIKYSPISEYEILYIGGNAMFTEAYHEYYDKKCIDLIYDTKRYILFTSRKSWRNIDYQQLKQKMAVYLSKKKIFISR